MEYLPLTKALIKTFFVWHCYISQELRMLIIVFLSCSFRKQTRPAVIDALNMVDLSGRNGIASESSPGIFLQVGGK
jgi:hypothetical protein